MNITAPKSEIFFGLIVLYIVWGTTWVGMVYTVRSMPPLAATGLRLISASLLMFIFLAIKNGRSSLSITRSEFDTTLLLGVFMSAAGMGTSILATQVVPIGVASLVVASMPMWVALIRFLEKDHPSKTTLFGLALGIGGIALVMLPGKTQPVSGASGKDVFFWCVVLVIGTFSWAYAAHRSKDMAKPANPFTSSAYQLFFGGFALLIAGYLRGEKIQDFFDATAVSFTAWVYLILFGSIIGFSTYVWLIKHAPISLVSTYAFMNPIVAILLGKFLFGNKTNTVVIIGGSMVLVAVAILIAAESRTVKFTEAEHV